MSSRICLLLPIVALCSISASSQTNPPVPNHEATPSAAASTRNVTAPRAIYNPNPEYSEKARQAKLQGVCVLWVVVGSDGIPHDIKVARSLGMGLDEQAIKAVKQWKFDPAHRDGVPVAAQVNIEVSFRLYAELATSREIAELSQRALAGDLEATTKLGLAYLNGDGTAADSARGMKLLRYAAGHGSTHAQFELAQQIVKSPPEQGIADYVSAYSWYGIAQRGGHKVKDKIFSYLESKMTADQLAEARARIDAWPNLPAK